jgi:two-component system sensor histidine kinase YesM
MVYNNCKSIVENEIRSDSSNYLQKETTFVDSLIYSADCTCISLLLYKDTQMFMLPGTGGSSNNDLIVNIKSNINQLYLTNKYIDSIAIYSDANKYIISNIQNSGLNGYTDKEWLNSYFQDKSSDNSIIEARKYNNLYPYVITCIKTSNAFHGAVSVNINAETLRDDISKVNDGIQQKLLIIDGSGKVVFDSDLDNLGKNIKNIKGYTWLGKSLEKPESFENLKGNIVQISNSQYYGLKYIMVIPMDNFINKFSQIRDFILLLSLLSVFATFFATFFISVKAYKPVSNILSAIDENQDDKSGKALMNSLKDNEVNYIVNNIKKNVNFNAEMQQTLKQHIFLLNKAQTDVLQYQINPHFLINTLESIKWMTIDLTENENKAALMIDTLGDFLRSMMDNERKLIPVSEEIAYVKQYVSILMVRYESKFDVEWNISDRILDCKIIKLTLQPLIENSIHHGLKPKNQKGYIKISGYRQENNILIKVIDDGVGMDQETVEMINTNMSEDYMSSDVHIGLRNVNQRIKLMFGNEYGLFIKSVVNAETSVTIKLPVVT